MTFDIGNNITVVLLAIIAAFPAVVAAYYGHKAATKIDLTHDLVNGQSEKLNAAIAGQAHAEGVVVGENAQRERNGQFPVDPPG